MAKRFVPVAICLSLGLAFLSGAACTSVPDRKVLPAGFHASKDGGNPGTHEDGGGDGTGGKGGGGGATGTGGKGTTTTDGGTTDGGTTDGGAAVVCGGSQCRDFTGFGIALTSCCTGTDGATCGLDTKPIGGPGCLELNQPGSADDTCPPLTTDGTTHDGCCLDRSSTCGVSFAVPGGPNFGCVDLVPFGSGTKKDCTPVCSSPKGPCTYDSDCCDNPGAVEACITFGTSGAGQCTSFCATDKECASGCCVFVPGRGRGVCAPDTSACPSTCRGPDGTCEVDADCCSGTVCVASGGTGPRICRPACNTAAQCGTEYCVPDATTGKSACTRQYAGLCSDTCAFANDGACDDGGKKAESGVCALGTDCTDCKKASSEPARLGGFAACDDTCATHGDGVCDDGGTGSVNYSCFYGADCADCGPRLGICSDACEFANDGYCDDGSRNAYSAACATGTDCTDCGVVWGGRNQNACDGTKGTYCNPKGIVWFSDPVEDGTCQCDDCAWDTADCGVTKSLCDGKAISTCCAPGNPCNFDGDGFCDCGGWCDWETTDCGHTGGLKCDGSIASWCDYKDPYGTDGVCDCKGVCSFEKADCAADYPNVLCDDTCTSAGDGVCDDDFYCDLGTDCADCGARQK